MENIFKKDSKKRLTISLILSYLYAFPLLIYGGYYIDDIGRSLHGYESWGAVGRPLADFVMTFLFLGKTLADISPIPQILAIGMIGFLIAEISKKYTQEGPFVGVVSCLPLLTCPFLLQNLSYKYDAFTMGLSLFFSVSPFLFKNVRNTSFFFLSCVSLVSSLSLYQASINIFIIFSILLFMVKIDEGDVVDAYGKAASSLLALITSYFIYSKIVIGTIFPPQKYGYPQIHSEMISLSSKDAVHKIINNYDGFMSLVSSAYRGIAIVLLLPVFLFFIKYIAESFIKEARKPGVSPKITSILLLASPFVIFLLIPGPMLLLKEPVFMVRTLMGAAAFLTVVSILALKAVPSRAQWAKYLWIAPIFGMYSISYTYVNAIRAQDQLQNMVVEQLANNISSYHLYKDKYVAINGQIPHSLGANLAFSKYPIISHLLVFPMTGVWGWGYAQLVHYGIHLKEAPNQFFLHMARNICSYKLINTGMYFNLYQHNSTIIVDFNKTKCQGM